MQNTENEELEASEEYGSADELIPLDEDLITADEEEYLFPTADEVIDSKCPAVVMVFDSLDKAVRFVNVYGKIHGFAVIKGRNHKNIKITLQCNKSRKPRTKSVLDRKRKRHVLDRTNCPMNVTVKDIDSKWHIISTSMDHNHDCCPSPSLTKFFLSHRTMPEPEIMLSRLLQEIRVKP
jgi:hypothetical protein